MARSVAVLAALLALAVFAGGGVGYAQAGYVDSPVGSTQAVTTVTGVKVHSSFGPPENYFAVFRVFPLVPGKRYEATLTYDAGSSISYGHCWVDGDPGAKEWHSFLGVGSGTGSRELKGKEERFLFTVDAASSSNVLYVLVSSNKPWPIRFGVTDRLSGLSRDSQDRWGYYYVSDFDDSKYSPFLLKRGGTVAPPAAGAGRPAAGARVLGPLAFSAGKMAGTLRLAWISEKEGVVWLRVEGTGVEELLNAVFKGSEVKFVRTVDCRLGASDPYAQVFTGRINPDGSLSGSFANDDEPSLTYPWKAARK